MSDLQWFEASIVFFAVLAAVFVATAVILARDDDRGEAEVSDDDTGRRTP